jgi:hypothetical protein
MALRLARQAWANGFAMANSTAGLLMLSSVGIDVLLPRLAAALNPIEEDELKRMSWDHDGYIDQSEWFGSYEVGYGGLICALTPPDHP